MAATAKATTTTRTPATRTVSKWIDGLYCARQRRCTELRDAMAELKQGLWNKYRDDSAAQNDRYREMERLNGLAETFAYEVFAGLYDAGGIAELERPAPDTGWMELAHGVIGGMPKISGTAGDPDMAAIATGKLVAGMMPALDALIEEANNAEQQSGGGGGGGGVGAASGGSPISGTDVARAIMRKAADEAAKEVQDLKDQLNSLQPGLGDAPADGGEADSGRLELAERIGSDERIQKALALAGVLRRCAESDRSEVDPQGKSYVYGLEIGNDLGRVLPQEIAGLRNPALRMLTLKRYTERTLQQYRLEGKETLGRGPMVVLVDASGSMRGEAYLYATAMAIAAIGLCAREQRTCTVLTFNRRVVDAVRLNADGTATYLGVGRPDYIENQPIEGGAAELAMRIARSRPRGGTDFKAPLQYALKMREGLQDERSDLMLITDGYADVPVGILDQLNEAKSTGMKVWGFTVAGGSLGAAVQTLCDTTLDLDAATDEEIGRAMA